MDQQTIAELAGWAVAFTSAVQKIKESAENDTEATLTSDESKAMVEGLRVAFKVPKEG